MEILDPEQLAGEGQAAYNRADYLTAAHLFEAAGEGYQIVGNPLMAAEMANNCSVAYLKGADPQSALNAVIGTEQVFADHQDPLRQAMALGNRSAAMEGLNQLEQAIATYTQSAEILKSLGESELYAYVMQSISAIQLRQGQYMLAYATMSMGVMGLEKPDLTQKLFKILLQLPFKFLR
jgi:tetratricopeptide (TPR) repeat protein